jgi:hypothetical protein
MVLKEVPVWLAGKPLPWSLEPGDLTLPGANRQAT